jgi:hypothetical protein
VIPVYNDADRTEADRMAHGKQLYLRRGSCWYWHADAPTEAWAARWVHGRVLVGAWNIDPRRWAEKLRRDAA